MFEIQQSLKARKLRKCPMCGKQSLERVILEAPLGFVKGGDPTTIGKQAEVNTKKMGELGVKRAMEQRERQAEYTRQSNFDRIREKMPVGTKLLGIGNTDKPWYGQMDKATKQKINSDTTGKKAHKYIMEGK